MADSEKIAAVEEYLADQLGPCTVETAHDSARGGQVFKVKSASETSTVIVERAFFEKFSAEVIPGKLSEFLLAEHLRECNFTLYVTESGLTD